MSGWSDEVVLVTGSSRGIGRQIALDLGATGAQVLTAARSVEAAEETAALIAARGGRARALALDVRTEETCARVLQDALSDYGTIPLLVNNAGITQDGLALRMKAEDWNAVIDTNLGGAFRVCRALIPSMVRHRRGRIVNISSVVAHLGNPGQVNYTASKAGLEGLTRSLARELASRNITVNCVAPGFIDTDMTRALDERARARLLDQVPLGRLGQPADVSAAVKFLLGPEAGYITGITLHVNGGMYM